MPINDDVALCGIVCNEVCWVADMPNKSKVPTLSQIDETSAFNPRIAAVTLAPPFAPLRRPAIPYLVADKESSKTDFFLNVKGWYRTSIARVGP